MTERGRRLSLAKSDLATPAGRELLELLTGFSADGSITREELERLRGWLEANREAPIQAREFLTSVVDAIPERGEVAAAELEALHTAIERVLPSPGMTPGRAEDSYAAAAADLSMSGGAVRVAVHRMRRRFRDILRAEIGLTVDAADIEEEIQFLIWRRWPSGPAS